MLRGVSRRLFSNNVLKAVPVEWTRFESEAMIALEAILDAVESAPWDAVNKLNDGVLRIDIDTNTFILNKHAVTQQIWYSSPVIGPAYFDALTSEGHRWWSLKLGIDLFTQLKRDVSKVTSGEVQLDITQ